MQTTRQWKFKINVWDDSTLFFPDFLRNRNMVRVIEGNLYKKGTEGKQKLVRVSGRYELPRVKLQ